MSRVAPAAVLALLTLCFFGAPVPGAAAAPTRCKVAGFSPRSATGGLAPFSVRFRVQASGCPVRTWQLAAARQPVASAASPATSLDPASMHNVDAGAYNISVWVAGRSGGTDLRDFPDGFLILRATRWTPTGAVPARVAKGRSLRLSAVLRRVDWNRHRYTAYGHVPALVQFRPAGAKSWRTVHTLPTTAGGGLSATVRPTTTGSWRLAFLGTRTSAGSVTPARAVTVPAPTRRA